MTIVPVQQGDSSPPTPLVPVQLAIDETVLVSSADPWERARQASLLLKLLQQLSTAVREVRKQAVHELVNKHRAPKSRVARHIGVTPTRIDQLVRPPATSEVAA